VLPLLLVPTALAAAPRQPIAAQRLVAPPAVTSPLQAARLTVKLVDSLGARADGVGGLKSAQPGSLAAVERVAADLGLRFRPLIALDPARLDALEARATARSGVAQPDLQAFFIVDGPTTGDAMVAAGDALQALPQVEYASIERTGTPPPEDLGTATPDWSADQTYLDGDPGIGAWPANDLGVRGASVRLSDCEYGWKAGHEDLVDKDLQLEEGQTIHRQIVKLGYDEHGTAVMGEIAGVDNGYGVTGGAPDVEIATYPEYTVEEGSRRVAAITSAIADSDAGDVVVLEMQTSTRGASAYGPAELDPNVWAVVKTGTDAGVIVVGAAGNGTQDLDSSAYASYQALGDSGAILVGAGSADSSHQALSFSTYGSRVNLQGWGELVTTLAYGDLAEIDGDPLQRYTARFNGTSSATPVVATAVTLVQDYTITTFGVPLSPNAMRALLVETGIPQSGSHHIGPLPQVLDAIDALDVDGDGLLSWRWGGSDKDDDAGGDTGVGDGGSADGGSPDGGSPDGGSPDGGSSDGGGLDGGSSDSGTTGADGGDADGGDADGGGSDGGSLTPPPDTGCGGCSQAAGARGTLAWLLLTPLLALRRRRGCAQRR